MKGICHRKAFYILTSELIKHYLKTIKQLEFLFTKLQRINSTTVIYLKAWSYIKNSLRQRLQK